MTLTEDDETFLSRFFQENEEDTDYDEDAESFSGSDFDDFADSTEHGRTPAPMCQNLKFSRSDSVGGSALALLHLNDDVKDFGQSPKHDRRRSMKLAKFARMSLCAAASDLPKHCLRLSGSPIKKMSLSSELSECVSFESVTKSTDAFSHILSFLNEGELTHSTSLVCTKWADAAAKSLSTLMLLSVGCDPSFISNADDDDSSVIDDLDSPEMNDDTLTSSSVAKSMEKGWDFLTNCFPWAQYLSDGAFKRVYRVWNERFGAYEAISVM